MMILLIDVELSFNFGDDEEFYCLFADREIPGIPMTFKFKSDCKLRY